MPMDSREFRKLLNTEKGQFLDGDLSLRARWSNEDGRLDFLLWLCIGGSDPLLFDLTPGQEALIRDAVNQGKLKIRTE
ncbi:hypothetical protein HY374_02720 [Candidatus Berkelbacteria bacterium]|nr:hypothetical protein [Candidatus Berkelbacteria bacterium]